MKRLLILSEAENDLQALLQRAVPTAVCCPPTATEIPWEQFDAVCILGGNAREPLTLSAPIRQRVEDMRSQGKRVFAEYVASISQMYGDQPIRTTHHRMMVMDGTRFALPAGTLLDEHYNQRIPYYFLPPTAHPWLKSYDHLCGHDFVTPDEKTVTGGAFALGTTDEHTLICAFRLCNFHRARMAPRASWECVIRAVVAFLMEEELELTFEAPICRHHSREVNCAADIDATVARGLRWLLRADLLKEQGRLGVKEGFSHHVDAANGQQLRANTVRADCTGEVGGAFLMDAICGGGAESRAIYEHTADYCFGAMQIKQGAHRGMLRWTETAWEVCYQDDVARAILPTLLAENFGGGAAHFADACLALDYLVATTGADGLRPFRTDLCDMTEQRLAQLRQAGVGVPSAHYNAYYHAALLLAGRAGASESYAAVAERGLTSLMALYPNTRRETSETEEMCRLVLPLALLYEQTGKREHYDWLRRVVTDLERVQHPSGAFAEWDTGYRAACARNDHGECALLANNGDPVADLLYSNNWLPLGFSYAYFVTGEHWFYRKWCDVARFFVTAQLQSDDVLLDGAWTRAMDLDRMESYGVPHDVGWAPCCIETGWTVGEILMGLQFMHLAERKWQQGSTSKR